MTTPPDEPMEAPQVVPSGDPAVQPDHNPATPGEPGPGPVPTPDPMPDWEPDQGVPKTTWAPARVTSAAARRDFGAANVVEAPKRR